MVWGGGFTAKCPRLKKCAAGRCFWGSSNTNFPLFFTSRCTSEEHRMVDCSRVLAAARVCERRQGGRGTDNDRIKQMQVGARCTVELSKKQRCECAKGCKGVASVAGRHTIRRAARFTPLPSTEYSFRCSPPTLPQYTWDPNPARDGELDSRAQVHSRARGTPASPQKKKTHPSFVNERHVA